MPLKVIWRSDRAHFQIQGSVRLPDGSRKWVRLRATSNDISIAKEEAVAMERRLTGLAVEMPAAPGLLRRIEAIALLAEGGATNLPKIAKLADEVICLWPTEHQRPVPRQAPRTTELKVVPLWRL